jgi:hypothetical protein
MLLATASKEVAVKIWNVFLGEQVGELRGHDGEEVRSLSVTPVLAL